MSAAQHNSTAASESVSVCRTPRHGLLEILLLPDGISSFLRTKHNIQKFKRGTTYQ